MKQHSGHQWIMFRQASEPNPYHMNTIQHHYEIPSAFIVFCWQWVHGLIRSASHPNPTLSLKTTLGAGWLIGPNHILPIGPLEDWQCHKPKWGTVSSVVVLTEVPWWVFFHILWMLKNVELTCCHLSITVNNSSQTALVRIIKDPWLTTALSTEGSNAFHQVFPVYITLYIQKCNVLFI